ncbi:hypothetical protein, partial [Zhenpiania hominis]|uniref:hypothetical protein n=1 Tax=Zhenpiania hominis TaxID=2763644 RepID=UPI0039F5C81F
NIHFTIEIVRSPAIKDDFHEKIEKNAICKGVPTLCSRAAQIANKIQCFVRALPKIPFLPGSGKNNEVFMIIFRIYLNSAGGYGTLRVRKGRREHVRICNGGQAGAENAGI